MPLPTPMSPTVSLPKLSLVVVSAFPEKLRAFRFTSFRSGLPFAEPRNDAVSFSDPTAND
ncbi:MAG: hypothetical protein EBU08_04025 [Micrococcales bacterium]|nr:hypothetical protein [Micrococcales bacterium]